MFWKPATVRPLRRNALWWIAAFSPAAGWLVCPELLGAETVAERFADGIRLAVTRSIDADGEPTELEISLEDWLAYVAKEPNLRVRTESRQGRNSLTGKEMEVRATEGSSEILVEGHALSFFYYSGGSLELFLDDWHVKDAEDPVLRAVEAVARHFDAVIADGYSYEIVEW